jgi:hypothetical protein
LLLCATFLLGILHVSSEAVHERKHENQQAAPAGRPHAPLSVPLVDTVDTLGHMGACECGCGDAASCWALHVGQQLVRDNTRIVLASRERAWRRFWRVESRSTAGTPRTHIEIIKDDG